MAGETPVTPRRLAQAYLALFGDVTHADTLDTDHQLVWRDIESFCRAYRLSCESTTTGEYAENNTLVNEGRRSMWLRIRGQVLIALAPEPEPIKVSRQKKKQSQSNP